MSAIPYVSPHVKELINPGFAILSNKTSIYLRISPLNLTLTFYQQVSYFVQPGCCVCVYVDVSTCSQEEDRVHLPL